MTVTYSLSDTAVRALDSISFKDDNSSLRLDQTTVDMFTDVAGHTQSKTEGQIPSGPKAKSPTSP
jgi:hypothetical protein